MEHGRRFGLGVLAVGAVALLAVWQLWWRQPDGSWACGADDTTSGCRRDTVLRLPATPESLEYRIMAAVPIDVVGDGSRVVVALGAERSDRHDGEALVALYDTTTGRMIRDLLHYPVDPVDDRSPAERRADPVPRRADHIDAVATSPDGSRVAVVRAITVADSDGEVILSEAAVIDVASGEPLVDFFDVGSCSGSAALGFSADNALLQCDFVVFDPTTGDAIGRVDYDAADPADQASGVRSVEPVVDLRRRCTTERICVAGPPDGGRFVDRVSGDIVAETDDRSVGSLARFGSDGRVAWYARPNGSPRSGIARLAPRRTGPTTTVTAVDIHSGMVLNRFETELLLPLSESLAVGPSSVVVYDRHRLRLQVFEPDWA